MAPKVKEVLKAVLLKSVMLEFTVGDLYRPFSSDCPLYVRTLDATRGALHGVPYILDADSGSHVYITNEHIKELGITESNLIYHAKENSKQKLEDFLAKDREERISKVKELSADGFNNKEIAEKVAITTNNVLRPVIPKYYGSKDDALTDLVCLQHYSAAHGSMTLGDIKNYLDIPSTDPNEFKWGWKDLSDAKVIYVDCCYAIQLPENSTRLYSGRYAMTES